MIQTFGAMGKSQMLEGEPIKLSTTFVVYCQKLVELVIAWDGQGMTTQIRIREAISL